MAPTVLSSASPHERLFTGCVSAIPAFSAQVLVHTFRLFLNLIFSLSLKSSSCSLDISRLSDGFSVCKCLPPVCSLSFHSLSDVF